MKRRVPVVYNPGDTFFHRRDPRAKLLALAVIFLFIYVAPTWQWMAAGAAVGLAMTVVARVPWKWVAILVALQIPQVLTFLAFPAVGRLLSGQPPLAGDFDFVLKVVLTWQVALFAGAAVFTTMELHELTDGLRGLGVPEVLVFTIEYIFLLIYITISDFYRLIDSMKAKGINIETKNPITLARNFPKLGIPMMFSVLRRSTTMMAVLKMRGYSFTERPELRSVQKWDAGDTALVAFAVAVSGGTALVRFGLLTVPGARLLGV